MSVGKMRRAHERIADALRLSDRMLVQALRRVTCMLNLHRWAVGARSARSSSIFWQCERCGKRID